MRNRTGNNTTGELLVVISYCLYIAFEILNYTQFKNIPGWPWIHRMIEVLVALITATGIFSKTKQSIKWLVLSAILVAVGFIIVIFNDQLINTAILLLFIVAGSNIRDEKIFHYHWVIVSALVGFTLLLYVMGIYKPDYIIRRTLSGQTERAYLGFSYTTYAPNYLIHLMFSFYASRKKQIQIKDTIAFLSINYLFYRLTATYAVFYEVILLVICLWLLKYYEKLFSKKIFGVLFSMFMPIMAVLSLWLSIIYTPSNSILLMMNQLLSSRLSLAHTGIMRYGLTLFGNPVEWSGGRYGIERFDAYFYVDSSYVNIALTYGLVTLLFVVLCFALMNHKAYKMGNYKLCIVFAFLALHSFTDPQLLELKYNPFLVVLFAAFIPSMEQVLAIGLKKDRVQSTITKRRKIIRTRKIQRSI